MLSKNSIGKSLGGSLPGHQGTLASSWTTLCAVAVAIVAAAFALSWRTRAADALGPGPVATRAKLPAVLIARLPLAFEPNCGQADPHAQFVAHTASATVFLTSTGAAV